jgi:tripartite-type tricarboxylate transporter receptor subunit TctC
MLSLCLALNTFAASVDVIVPFAAGGPTDQFVRSVIVPGLKRNVGALEIFATNILGDGGLTGIAEGAKKKNSMVVIDDATVLNYERKFGKKINVEWTLIALLAIKPMALVVKPEQLTKFAGLSTGLSMSLAHAGEGTATWRCANQIRQAYGQGIKLKAYSGGEGPATVAVLDGAVDGICTSTLGSVVHQGKLVPVAKTRQIETGLLAKVPLFPSTNPINSTGFIALYAPTGIDVASQSAISGAVGKVISEPEYNLALENLGYLPSPSVR